jgi:type VI secretion system protein ImpE
MEPADKLLAAGDLEGARQSLIATLRAEPRDPAARMLLFQILSVTGEWEKASAQLRAIAQLDPEAQMLQTAYNQVIAAEQARAAAFAGSTPMTILVEAPEWVNALARSLEAFAKGNAAEGNELRDRAFDGAPDSAGTLNDCEFTRLADVDARFGPVFEAMIAGRWGLVPFETVSEIRSEGPKDLCDVVWLPIEMTLRSGPGLAGFIPARYPGTERAPERDLRLGKRTE